MICNEADFVDIVVGMQNLRCRSLVDARETPWTPF